MDPSPFTCPPDAIHVVSSQAFLIFRHSSASVYYTECKPKQNKTKQKNREA